MIQVFVLLMTKNVRDLPLMWMLLCVCGGDTIETDVVFATRPLFGIKERENPGKLLAPRSRFPHRDGNFVESSKIRALNRISDNYENDY